VTFSALRIRPLGWAVLLLAALLLTSACGRSEKIVFEGYGPAEERPPYTPIAQSGGRLVRPVDSATPAPTVLIGSEKQPNHAPAPYAPIAESHSALVTNEEEREPFRPVRIGPERGEASSARQQPPARPAASPTPIPSANRAPGQPVIQSTGPPPHAGRRGGRGAGGCRHARPGVAGPLQPGHQPRDARPGLRPHGRPGRERRRRRGTQRPD
jgi:hypothetical protein